MRGCRGAQARGLLVLVKARLKAFADADADAAFDTDAGAGADSGAGADGSALYDTVGAVSVASRQVVA
eukprot:868227-Pleurochrysis_carterae.AAC.2